jgi:hypothetical protein
LAIAKPQENGKLKSEIEKWMNFNECVARERAGEKALIKCGEHWVLAEWRIAPKSNGVNW